MFIGENYIKAGHPETLPSELGQLASHPDSTVRRRVAENHRTPITSLLNLAADPEPEVRVAIAFHPAISMELLFQLAQDECVDVRYELAEITNLPRTILNLLASDDNPYVAFRARQTLLAREKHIYKITSKPEGLAIDHMGTKPGSKTSTSSEITVMANSDRISRERIMN